MLFLNNYISSLLKMMSLGIGGDDGAHDSIFSGISVCIVRK